MTHMAIISQTLLTVWIITSHTDLLCVYKNLVVGLSIIHYIYFCRKLVDSKTKIFKVTGKIGYRQLAPCKPD